jgi:lipoyl(octanoyl) transferase
VSEALRVEIFPGLVPYETAHELQLALVEERSREARPDTLLLLQHAPVITLGRNADPRGVLVSPEALVSAGIALHRVERGGQATYHGPGQVVGYPILQLRARGLGVRAYVGMLEDVLIGVAGRYGVEAFRVPGRPGVFCAVGKLAAVGVAVRHGVSYHGFAFNVAPDLDHFRTIVPCGLTDVEPASLKAVLRDPPSVAEVLTTVAEVFRTVFAPGS